VFNNSQEKSLRW